MFVTISDPRQAGKVTHDLVELLVVAVNAVLVGADTFVEIELWAKEKLDWLRQYLKLEHDIPSHDTFGRLFGLIDPGNSKLPFGNGSAGYCLPWERTPLSPSMARPAGAPGRWAPPTSIWSALL